MCRALLPNPGDSRGAPRKHGNGGQCRLTLDVYADLFDAALDAVAANLDAAIRAACPPMVSERPSNTYDREGRWHGNIQGHHRAGGDRAWACPPTSTSTANTQTGSCRSGVTRLMEGLQ